MHCRTCEYPLWNLATRTCPECGAAFMPSGFEFVPNSVRFCCPHCRKAYYGTAANGHLVPDRFTCVGCAQAISMDECVVLPADGVADEQTKPEFHPWFDPRLRWRFGSWFGMIGRSLFVPGRQMRSIPPSKGMGFLLGTILSAAGGWVSIGILFTLPILMLVRSGSGSNVSLKVLGWILLGIALVLIAIAGTLALWIAATHLLLMVSGGAPRGFKRTGQAICFTAPLLLPLAIPCVGMYLTIILLPWWTISAGIAAAAGHGIPTWRGILAAMILPVSMITAFVILLVFVFPWR